jgi:hypothetical protein
MAGRFRVDEPCVIARVVSMPAPRWRKALATGTMQAEQRFMAGPINSPLAEPLIPRWYKPRLDSAGKRNTSVSPATRKAKIIPRVINLR